MMRSLYAGVAGLKTHQTKMDVIGNNIANVNTVGYKSSSITFSELMYQTTQSASGPNAETGRGGVNARQIGLGVQTGAITTKIATPGGSQNTGNPFDIQITGDAFFVVSDGVSNYFTRDGAFGIDASGNLAMASNGYNVMGWGVNGEGNIAQGTVSPLRILQESNMTYPPEATSKGKVEGVLDKNDVSLNSVEGKIINMEFYDAVGYSYTAKMSIHASRKEGDYYVQLEDVLNADGESIKDTYNIDELSKIVTFGEENIVETEEIVELLEDSDYNATTGEYSRKTGMSGAFSDYDSDRIGGMEYSAPTNAGGTTIANGDVLADGDEVTFTGKGSVTQEDLKAKGIVYNEGDGFYYGTDGTSTKLDSEAAWSTALGLDVKVVGVIDPDNKSIALEIEQKFTVGGTVTADDITTLGFSSKITQAEAYGLDTSDPNVSYKDFVITPSGTAKVTVTETINGHMLKFDTETGKFVSVGNPPGNSALIDFNENAINKKGETIQLGQFSDIDVDFSTTKSYGKKGKSTIAMTSGDVKTEGLGAGRALGELTGVGIDNAGLVFATYSNGQTKLLGQIAVAEFANASGLEKAGNNLYSATMNSGAFDGTGLDITGAGGQMSTGVLEMSNVDLSQEFTDMITTQRGFQANSRIITTSDSLLEELVNLKR